MFPAPYVHTSRLACGVLCLWSSLINLKNFVTSQSCKFLLNLNSQWTSSPCSLRIRRNDIPFCMKCCTYLEMWYSKPQIFLHYLCLQKLTLLLLPTLKDTFPKTSPHPFKIFFQSCDNFVPSLFKIQYFFVITPPKDILLFSHFHSNALLKTSKSLIPTPSQHFAIVTFSQSTRWNFLSPLEASHRRSF